MSADDYALQLAALRREYAARLPQRVADLDARFASLVARWEPDAALELRRLAHNLAGSGASYGLPEVSSRAKDVERALDAAIDAAAPPEPALRAIRDALGALADAVAAQPRD